MPSSKLLTTAPNHAISLTGLATISRGAKIVISASMSAEEKTKNKSGAGNLGEIQSTRSALFQSTKNSTPARGAMKLCHAAIPYILVLLMKGVKP